MRLRRLATGLAALLMQASTAFADLPEEELARVLRVDEVASILRDEGLRYGVELEADMLGGGGGRYFQDRVAALYDADAMSEALTAALVQTLDTAQMRAVVDFFDTDEGQRILTLENAGRVAMADPAVEGLARATYQDLAGSDDPHLADVERFVDINDLIERNVTSGLESNYHFFRGLADGGGTRMGEDEILSEVWAQADGLRADTTSWIYGFLLMAYQPLSGDALQSYSDFSATSTGQALNQALFNGFDQIYNDISYKLGLAVAQAMNGSDI
ncbi:DUF2059 domain-containing protein [Sedimentitalea todarodis]|uniref:DUF2059 domain-containing protein n=1 Tax=Sedimentitalea todarodis TaxID=1631240 RepID=A0ABU3VL31_9RHOB|nr:DUF2059 domain-containing protein [Sedimentitalea todarodis]MDU9006389.1 DUF2059 domain-containing protein [Sedimentitalea todarodis]